MNRAEQLNGIVERRTVSFDLETRAKGNTLTFSGYASLFNTPYEMYGGPEKGGWVETVAAGAFNKTLGMKPDVVLLINHDGMPLARTSSGTMQLSTDARGLKVNANLDTRDPDVQALAVKMERRDMSQMSFAFRTIAQEWSNDETQRKLTELSLDRGDVSIVTNGANPRTDSTLRSIEEALDFLVKADLAEVRSSNGKALRAAQRVLSVFTPEARDADEDPAQMAQALDAVIDAIQDAIVTGNMGQIKALVDAAEISVDALLEFYGAVDADDLPSAYSAASNLSVAVTKSGRVTNLSPREQREETRQGTVALAEQLVTQYAQSRHA